jgi:hypothetical protein
MDSKEHAAAGNALVDWFNSQEINQTDAAMIMSKVLAKIITSQHRDRSATERAIDTFTLSLVNNVNARRYNDKWLPPR